MIDFVYLDYGIQYRPLLDSFIRTWKDMPQDNRKGFEEECKRKTAAIWEVKFNFRVARCPILSSVI